MNSHAKVNEERVFMIHWCPLLQIEGDLLSVYIRLSDSRKERIHWDKYVFIPVMVANMSIIKVVATFLILIETIHSLSREFFHSSSIIFTITMKVMVLSKQFILLEIVGMKIISIVVIIMKMFIIRLIEEVKDNEGGDSGMCEPSGF